MHFSVVEMIRSSELGGKDRVYGEEGNGSLDGAEDSDTLSGGNGNDTTNSAEAIASRSEALPFSFFCTK